MLLKFNDLHTTGTEHFCYCILFRCSCLLLYYALLFLPPFLSLSLSLSLSLQSRHGFLSCAKHPPKFASFCWKWPLLVYQQLLEQHFKQCSINIASRHGKSPGLEKIWHLFWGFPRQPLTVTQPQTSLSHRTINNHPCCVTAGNLRSPSQIRRDKKRADDRKSKLCPQASESISPRLLEAAPGKDACVENDSDTSTPSLDTGHNMASVSLSSRT